jgi:hypothetical protein
MEFLEAAGPMGMLLLRAKADMRNLIVAYTLNLKNWPSRSTNFGLTKNNKI